jgi:hypothetical protein
VEITEDVISQGVVMVSILSGFAFFIAAEIALRDGTPEHMERVALWFFGTGLVLFFTAALGIIFFANDGNKSIQQQYGIVFLFFLVVSVCAFVVSLHQLLRAKMSPASYVALVILMVAVLFLIAMAVIVTLIT